MANSRDTTLFVLGGSGFLGRRVIDEAVKRGWRVMALARSDAAAAAVATAGATVIPGDAAEPQSWFGQVDDAACLIDLLQPARPKRVSRRQMQLISRRRQEYTRSLVDALRTLTTTPRPRLISVSGIDDLAPDRDGFLSAHSRLQNAASGFNTIGIPVREIIERSGVDCSFVYLGAVYGPGGPFGTAILPAVAAGKWKNFGESTDQMILIHVDDVARGLVSIAALDGTQASGKSFVLADMEPVSMPMFCGLAATLLRVRAPGRIPKWLAAWVAGRPIVETLLHKENARRTILPGSHLLYPSYREGLPATLCAMGLLNSSDPWTSAPSS